MDRYVSTWEFIYINLVEPIYKKLAILEKISKKKYNIIIRKYKNPIHPNIPRNLIIEAVVTYIEEHHELSILDFIINNEGLNSR